MMYGLHWMQLNFGAASSFRAHFLRPGTVLLTGDGNWIADKLAGYQWLCWDNLNGCWSLQSHNSAAAPRPTSWSWPHLLLLVLLCSLCFLLISTKCDQTRMLLAICLWPAFGDCLASAVI